MLFSGKEYSRRTRFETYEQAQLMALPTTIYQIKHHLVARVRKHCHVLLSQDKHYYSVPYRYVGKRVRLIYTQATVEIYAHYERIAVHQRDSRKYHYSTIKDHLPNTQQWVSDWNPLSFIRWAGRIGPQTQRAVEAVLSRRAHPEQTYKSCQGILSLEKKVGVDRLERACERALCYQSVSYKVIRSILERGLESLPESTPALPTTTHENIRGASAYQ